MNEYKRGSEWRKWDLHVHAPDTKLNNNYAKKDDEVDWDRFCETLHNSDVQAIGIADYFSLNGFYIFLEKYKAKYPEDNKVFFPNLELRLNEAVNKINETIDFHLIFRPNISPKTVNRFLSHLKTQLTDVNGLNIACSDLVTTTNFNSATVSRTDIAEALKAVFGEKTNWVNNVILMVPANNSGIRADSRSLRKMNIADEIDKFSNAVFGNPNNAAYFLSDDRYEDKAHKSLAKPVFGGSDAHSFEELSNWLGKQVLACENQKHITWVKADLTFEGLQQALLQPEDRVYLGAIPSPLERKNRNKQNYISSVTVNKVASPLNQSETWFDFSIPINSGLVSIIGNKGSGKSALSDIIALFSNCKTMHKASFLHEERFKKGNKKYAADYLGYIIWEDGKSEEQVSLNSPVSPSAIENAQYLPQRYIEDVCNDLDSGFKEEINKVIFSYVDPTERGQAINLDQLIHQKAMALKELIENHLTELKEINTNILRLEDKMTSEYMKLIDMGLSKFKEKLERHEKSKPTVMEKPAENIDLSYVKKLEDLDLRINDLEKQISEKRKQLTETNVTIDELSNAFTRIENAKNLVEKLSDELRILSEKNDIPDLNIKFDASKAIAAIELRSKELNDRKDKLQLELDDSDNFALEGSSLIQLQFVKKEKEALISSADEKEKLYQKYINDLSVWEEDKKTIIGTPTTMDCHEYYFHEKKYLESVLSTDYNLQLEQRTKKIEEIFRLKEKIACIYTTIYAPIEDKLDGLIGDMDDKIIFATELSLVNPNIGDELLLYINRSHTGVFNGVDKSTVMMKNFLHATDFNDFDSVKTFIENVYSVITEDYNAAPNKVKDRASFYDKLFGLSFIGAQYNLKVDNKGLESLSPGEKGIVLLVFYLALSKDERPLIIDQPEDNLDNQSVYCKLVKCIKEAKKKRQVIIVTHNPNIAVACDSEQIVYCTMDKSTHHISYESGSIENSIIKRHVIDVLEGTMPAFDLRRRKYETGL